MRRERARPRLWWWPLALAAAAAFILIYAALPRSAPPPSVLLGEWIREGDPYSLHVKEAKPDGTAAVEYYNPNPIRVSGARTSTEGGKLTLLVELRDANYPGCTYTLTYDPGSDRLEGEYYQALQRATYQVRFLRRK